MLKKVDLYSFAMICYEVISSKISLKTTQQPKIAMRPKLPKRLPQEVGTIIDRSLLATWAKSTPELFKLFV